MMVTLDHMIIEVRLHESMIAVQRPRLQSQSMSDCESFQSYQNMNSL